MRGFKQQGSNGFLTETADFLDGDLPARDSFPCAEPILDHPPPEEAECETPSIA